MHSERIPLHRLYHELAWLWPAMSPPEEYAEEAAHWRALLHQHLGPGHHAILELGVGGGHNLSHLCHEFQATAVDLSEAMLSHSRRLNPGVEHLVGDMRTLRLGRHFDAVLIHDAISHLLSEEEVLAALRTAAAHLRPGGLLLTAPDDLAETFVSPSLSHGQGSAEGITLHYCEHRSLLEPKGHIVETLLSYFIEGPSGRQVEWDRMHTGLFSLTHWQAMFERSGFAFTTKRFAHSALAHDYLILQGMKR